MLKKITGLSLLASLFIFLACSEDKASKDLDVITERIQYDVTIRTPYPDMDWWVQNIEGAKREELVRHIMNKAYDGKVQAYDYLGNKMTPEEVQAIGVREDTLLMPSMLPPFEDSLVIISERLRLTDIDRIRFLEEWQMDPHTLKIEKKVLGMALMRPDYAPNGELRGYRQLFWVYFDENYPEAFY